MPTSRSGSAHARRWPRWLVLLLLLAPAAAQAQEPLFDPERDPEIDLAAAIEEASATGRRIIMDVGGDWCGWCLLLDRFIKADPVIERVVDENFVWLRVNFSRENMNQAFLSRYPDIQAYPHLFVLEGDGTFLHSQDTAVLEEGRSYNRKKMLAFFKAWATEEG